jgi:hypothetical protein
MASATRPEIASYIFLIAGGAAALIGDRLSLESVRSAGLVAVFAGVLVFGVAMIVSRRAEISTRSSDVNPSFYVFRGAGAVAWGVAFLLFGGIFAGFALVELTGWTAPRDFFRERPGIVVALAGLGITALGVGSAGKATHRYKKTETAISRTAARIYGVFTALAGLGITALGLLSYLAPEAFAALKALLLDWVVSLIPK